MNDAVVIHRLGRANVDVISEYERATGGSVPAEIEYECVEILQSGWVRCSGRSEDSGGEGDLEVRDYYPQERIDGIYTVEESDR